jgi:hypothetical protein
MGAKFVQTIYLSLISPPVKPCTSNKLNELDLMGREWLETTIVLVCNGEWLKRVVICHTDELVKLT